MIPTNYRRRIVLSLLASVGLLFITMSVAQAASSYLTTWQGLYPNSLSDDNAGTQGCQLCHASSTQNLNPYGKAFCDQAGSTTARIQAVEAANSDLDPTSSSNLTEINASAQPGWTITAVPTYARGNCSATGSTETAAQAGVSGLLDPAAAPVCGDGTVDAGEQCDDGNTANNDGCSSTCQNEVCGDNIQQTNEQCDDGNQTNGDGCENDCTLTPAAPACGDGTVDAGEQCDDGNTVNNDGCSSTCQNEVCGDNIQQTNEQCDDGNQTNGDGCENDCTLTPAAACGDGTLDAGEQCDDGNTANNDGCSSTCQDEVCGDGIQQTNEQCDDGNQTNGDGCSSICMIEEDSCPDDPDKTEPGVCGCGRPDLDSDSDGIEDCIDNAPYTANQDQADGDLDGVGDAAELGPNGNDIQYDGNNDGTPDAQQSNVSSLFVNYGLDYVTLSTDAGNSLENVAYLPADQVADLPAGVDFPFGLFEFELLTPVPGGVATITLQLPAGSNPPGTTTVNTYYKFGPEPTNNVPHWYEFLYDPATDTGVELLDDVLTMTFTDGARGDDDLDATNGIIIDQGGPAFVSTGGGSSSSACFIATAAYGTSWEPHVMTLRQFRDSYLLTNKMGTKFVEAYYRFSPPIAEYIAEHDSLRSVTRIGIAPLVGFSFLAINYGMMVALAILFSVLTLIVGGTCFIVKTRETS